MTDIEKEVREFIGAWRPDRATPAMEFEEHVRELLGKIFDHIQAEADKKTIKTGSVSGMHYAALRETRKLLKLPERKT